MALTLVPVTVMAQDDDTGSDKREIVVTAQFVEENPIDVPLTLSVFGREDLERLGVEDFEELARFVPGFEVQSQSPNDPSFVMRGISSSIGPSYIEPRVSVFQDGVSISKARGAFVELYDIERIEVVKGPQSTLYGRSALIGAVNLIQAKPRIGEATGYVRADYGNYDAFLLESAANLPLSGNAALRLSSRWRKRDGIVENTGIGRDFSSVDTAAVRAAVRVEPSDRLTLDLIGNYQRDEPSGTGFVSLGLSQTDPLTGAVLSPPSPFNGAQLGYSHHTASGDRLGVDREVYGVTGLAEWTLGDDVTLNSVSAWREYGVVETLDADGVSLPILAGGDNASGRQFSQDLRLHWDNGGVLSAFVGASFFHQRARQTTPAVFDEALTLAQLAGALNGRIPGRAARDPAPLSVLIDTNFSRRLLLDLAALEGVAVDPGEALGIAANLKREHREVTTNFSRTRAWDVFADAKLRLSPRVELDLGIRYSHDAKRSAINGSILNGRSILGSYIAALSLEGLAQRFFLNRLSRPGAAENMSGGILAIPLIGLAGQPTSNNGDTDSAKLSSDGLSYRAIARYSPGLDASIYAGYARGRRPAQLSAFTPSVPFDPSRFETVRAETVDSFELGAKTALLDKRLYVDAALFHYRYSNFQTTELVGLLFVTTNAGKARSTGLEAQVRYSPTDWLEVLGSYAWNQSRFRSGARRGNHFRLSPDHSASLGLFASLPMRRGELRFSPSITWRSKVWFDGDNDRPDLQQPPAALVADNIQNEVQGAYALINARLGYQPEHGRWRLEAFVKNLFDKKYLRDAGNIGDEVGLATGVRGDPRTYGLSLRYEFGG